MFWCIVKHDFSVSHSKNMLEYRIIEAYLRCGDQLHGFIQSPSPTRREIASDAESWKSTPHLHISWTLEHLLNGTTSIINMKCPCSWESGFAESNPFRLHTHLKNTTITTVPTQKIWREVREPGTHRKLPPEVHGNWPSDSSSHNKSFIASHSRVKKHILYFVSPLVLLNISTLSFLSLSSIS